MRKCKKQKILMFQHEKLLVDYHLLECVSVCSRFRFRSSSWESEKRVQKNRENAHKFTRCGAQKPLRRSLLHNFHTKKLNVLHRETASEREKFKTICRRGSCLFFAHNNPPKNTTDKNVTSKRELLCERH